MSIVQMRICCGLLAFALLVLVVPIRAAPADLLFRNGNVHTVNDKQPRAEVIATRDLSPDVVTMHSTVRVRDLDSGTSVVYTLVFPVDADIEKKRISVLAPIGTALIGYRAGDVLEWATPGGTKRLHIQEVLFQPEAAAA